LAWEDERGSGKDRFRRRRSAIFALHSDGRLTADPREVAAERRFSYDDGIAGFRIETQRRAIRL
jgi:hypothetical protein